MRNPKNRRHVASFLYWLAVATTALTVGCVLFGNTQFLAPWEHTSFPIAWKFALVAVVSYFVHELCEPGKEKSGDSSHSLDHIPHEI